jgi:hypothetical protein
MTLFGGAYTLVCVCVRARVLCQTPFTEDKNELTQQRMRTNLAIEDVSFDIFTKVSQNAYKTIKMIKNLKSWHVLTRRVFASDCV